MIKTGGILTIAIAIFALQGCGLPRDPGGATDRIEGGSLRVGVVENPPRTVRIGDDVAGPEAGLVRALAAALHAKPVWSFGPESRLVPVLERRELDLVIGGFSADDPWASRVAVTRPYDRAGGRKHVLFVAPGENRWLLTLDRFIDARAGLQSGRD